MNVVFSAASSSVAIGWLMGLTTALFFASFAGWALWAFAPQNAERFRTLGKLPLDEGSNHGG